MIMDRWRNAIPSASTIVSIAMAIVRAIVRAEAMTVDRHILTVVPTFKAFSVLLTCGFAAGVSHREKNGGLSHTFRDFSLAHELLIFGAEWIEKCWVLLDANRRSAAAACQECV